GVDAGRGRLGGNPGTRITPRSGRFWHTAEALAEHGVAPDEAQAAECHVFAGSFDEFGHIGIQARLELRVAELAKNPWSRELKCQYVRQLTLLVEEAVRHLDFSA